MKGIKIAILWIIIAIAVGIIWYSITKEHEEFRGGRGGRGRGGRGRRGRGGWRRGYRRGWRRSYWGGGGYYPSYSYWYPWYYSWWPWGYYPLSGGYYYY